VHQAQNACHPSPKLARRGNRADLQKTEAAGRRVISKSSIQPLP
jgi:hypothetical protein